jgi:hypothetical protein
MREVITLTARGGLCDDWRGQTAKESKEKRKEKKRRKEKENTVM